jgi:TrmH family RNA methyltransferase
VGAAGSLRVVLISPRNPLNIGAAARAMSNFGFLDLRLVQPYTEAWREARSAVGAAAVLEAAQVCETLAEAAGDCSLVVGTASLGHRELKLPVRRLEYGARLIKKDSGAVALVFGSEKYGLSNEDLSRCHWLLRIPTRLEHESMNLGQAVAVCLYELARDARAAVRAPKGQRRASGADLDWIDALLGSALVQSGYIKDRTARSSELKLRRLIRRMDLTAADARVWLGMLRQICWKLSQTPPPA